VLATGFTLLVAAGLAAGAASTNKSTHVAHSKTGLAMNVNFSSSDFDFLDPALAYLNISWQMRYLTDCKLLNYPDKSGAAGTVLQPEWAGLPVISKGGTVYTFTRTKTGGGCKFNTGEAVTAQSFADAINRDLNPAMQSPAVQFTGDIVGANAVAAGTATTASGVVVKNANTLQITLTKPGADFLARITMPFFAAIPHGMPINPKGETSFASAGPYYIASWNQGRNAEVDRNPNYTGPRPRNVSRFLITVNTDPDQSYLQVKSGQVDDDLAGPPPADKAALVSAGLLNKQFFVNAVASTTYVALNTSRPLFGSVKARQAVNYAVDRHAMLVQYGVLAGKKDDQFLAPGIPGYKDVSIYPLKAPTIAKAKSLYSGGGSAVIYVRNRAYQLAQGQILQYNLQQIGINASVQSFAAGVFYSKAGTKGEPFDAAIAAWGEDFPDPSDFLNTFFDGTNIQDTNNNDLSYFNVASISKDLEKAASLSGSSRFSTYGNLDVEIARDYAPHANLYHATMSDFLAPRMDPSCYVFQPIYGVTDLGAECFK
jgi:peptide/nickel transport system substrate-binding protein/oligopeptide transport system substrate-binding protein